MTVASSFIVTARNVLNNGQYGEEPGALHFLRLKPSATDYSPEDHIKVPNRWRTALIQAADGQEDEITGKTGNVLIFIHGYNNDRQSVLWRTRKLQSTLNDAGWNGVVVAFDWPSGNSTLGYLEDRDDAAQVADKIVTELLPMLVPINRDTPNGKVADPDPDCKIDVHMIGHSTGAFVAIEAFARAQRVGKLFKSDWRLGQLAFIAGDVAASCLAKDDDWARPMLDRIVRLTNYSNGHDAVLGASNAKRLGLAPRAGRIGAGMPIHPKVVNVDCSRYFETIDPKKADFTGTFCHSWHIGDKVFAMDLALTLQAGSDRWVLPTRNDGQGSLQLQAAEKLPFADMWKMEKAPA
jgi:pimeloyl-ACP methyl ester carboxylesterase